jgi:hypothetical protein
MLRRAHVCAVVCLTSACTGLIEGKPPAGDGTPPGGAQPGPGGGGMNPGNQPGNGDPSNGGGAMNGGMLPPPAAAAGGRLRLLTRAQFESSLRDLLGDVTIAPTETDAIADGFASIGATYNAVSPRGLEQYQAAVLGALEPVFADPARRAALLGCAPAAAGGAADEACARRFVTGFGRRAWRRPLTTAETERYVQLAIGAADALKDANAALMHTTSALLVSPHFLYRVELGQPEAGGRFRYTGWEMASRLSYLLWNTTPDNQLLAAAEGGKLTTADGIRAEVARLLASPRARAGVARVGAELAGLRALPETPKDDDRFTPTLRAAMAAEVNHLFESRLDPGANLLDLVDSATAFVNGELAALYGLPGVTGAGMVTAPLPAAGPRAGLLGTGAFLSLQSKQDATSPTARGKFVREALLCQPVPDPPENVDTTLAEPPPGTKPTLREHMEIHRSNPACAACHALIDPLGYAFEGFDWLGAVRDRDNGKPVDTTGELEGVRFTGAREFVALLRKSPKVEDCLLRNIFKYAAGHRETPADEAELGAWKQAFAARGRQLGTFLTDIAASDGFRTVSPAP